MSSPVRCIALAFSMLLLLPAAAANPNRSQQQRPVARQTQNIRVKARVRGRVQGVNFRANTQAEGNRLGLAGWVTNLADGSVEFEAEGAPEVVQQLIDFCRSAPGSSRVDSLDHQDIPATDESPPFNVRW